MIVKAINSNFNIIFDDIYIETEASGYAIGKILSQLTLNNSD